MILVYWRLLLGRQHMLPCKALIDSLLRLKFPSMFADLQTRWKTWKFRNKTRNAVGISNPNNNNSRFTCTIHQTPRPRTLLRLKFSSVSTRSGDAVGISSCDESTTVSTDEQHSLGCEWGVSSGAAITSKAKESRASVRAGVRRQNNIALNIYRGRTYWFQLCIP